MKVQELKQKSNKELQEFLQERRRRVDELRFQLSQKKVKNVKELAGIKKDIARILTILKLKKEV
jgi:ribosomal protein L29